MEAGELLVELPVRDRRRSSMWRGHCSVGVLLLVGALLCAPASIAATPADTAATHTYLEASYQLDLAMVRNAGASRSSLAGVVERVGEECHGVLAGAPNEAAGPATQSPSRRQQGERQRSQAQMQTIEQELSLTTLAALYQPDLAAAEAYVAQVAPLSWSDPRIAPLVRFDAENLKRLFTPPTVDVCADMKSWAQSGYHVLSAASREFEATQTAFVKGRPEGSIASLLKSSEGAPELALIRQAKALRSKLSKALKAALDESSGLQRALGIPEREYEAREQEPVLGRGTTSAGSTFVVRREKHAGPGQSACPRSVSVELEERSRSSRGDFSEGSESSLCLSRRAGDQPSGQCGSTTETITAVVAASVRTVQMRLSNGHTIASSVVRISPRDGGPGGVYVQAVRGYSRYPVSLTELDRDGHPVAVVKVKFRCHNEPAASGPTFIDLAHGTTPGGDPFTIEATVVHFGKDETSFGLSLGLATAPNGNSEGSSTSESKPKAFSWQLGMKCQPHEATVVYGILAAPGASVLARTAAGLVPLTTVAIAPDLHSGGPLVYGAFSTPPSELVVLGSNGSTLYTESLVAKGEEEREFCEGYEER
jgi:hypothetical protein